jgi:hypothetical protein
VKVTAALLALALTPPLWSRSRDLTLNEAHTLARLTLVPKARNLPTLRFDTATGFGTRPEAFYWFEVTGDLCPDCSPILGHFAVNRATGDVWDAVSCKEYRSPELDRLRKTLERKIGLRHTERRHLNVAPCTP